MIKNTPEDTQTTTVKPSTKKAVVEKEKDADIVDIDFAVIKRTKFRLNGDNNCIIELNTADTNILSRLAPADLKLKALQNKVIKLTEREDTDNIESVGKELKAIDDEMRELVDYIFDSDVSSKCAAHGSMYDMLDGMFRYEHIIERLMKLYEDNLSEEYKKFKSRINKYAKPKK